MARRKKSRHSDPERSPKDHTVIVSDVQQMWEMLYWNVEVFGDIQRSYPVEYMPLAYSALNVCIASSSLQDWSKKRASRDTKVRGSGTRWSAKEFEEHLYRRIPLAADCRAIANTTKHSDFAQGARGSVSLVLEKSEPDEFDPGGYALRLIKDGEDQTNFFYNEVHDLPNTWWTFLREVDQVPDLNISERTPFWYRSKMSRVFGGGRLEQSPPEE